LLKALSGLRPLAITCISSAIELSMSTLLPRVSELMTQTHYISQLLVSALVMCVLAESYIFFAGNHAHSLPGNHVPFFFVLPGTMYMFFAGNHVPFFCCEPCVIFFAGIHVHFFDGNHVQLLAGWCSALQGFRRNCIDVVCTDPRKTGTHRSGP